MSQQSPQVRRLGFIRPIQRATQIHRHTQGYRSRSKRWNRRGKGASLITLLNRKVERANPTLAKEQVYSCGYTSEENVASLLRHVMFTTTTTDRIQQVENYRPAITADTA